MIIDDRAGSRELVFIHPLDEMAVLGRLDSADVSIVGNGPDGPISIGVEVKSVFDFLSSLETGRLTSPDEGQLPRMRRDYDECWILTYGGYRSGSFNELEVLRGGRYHKHRIGKRNVPYGYIEGAFLTAQVAGISHKHVEDEQQVAAWLGVLERWWDKEWEEHKAFFKFNRAGETGLIPDLAPDILQRMRVAATLPGVGWERALAAAASFNSVREMINATEQQWCDVPGIGKVLAKQIVRAVV